MSLDFQALKPQLKPYLDTYLQASPKAGPDFYECPFCESGRGPNATGAFHRQADNWRCFSCEERGDVTDLHSRLTNQSHGEAARDLSRLYGLQIETGHSDAQPLSALSAFTSAPSQHRPPSPTGSYGDVAIEAKREPSVDFSAWLNALADTVLTSNSAAVAYLEAHGLDPVGMQGKILLWDGSTSPTSAWDPAWGRKPSYPALIFPYPSRRYWHARILREGSQQRWDKPRNEIAGADPRLGLDSRLPDTGTVYIVEGITDAFILREAGKTAVCLSGTSGARDVANVLRADHCEGLDVVEALDRDEQGRKALERFKEIYCRHNKAGSSRPVLSLWDYVEDLEGINDPGDLAGRSQQALQDALDTIATPETRYEAESVGAGLYKFLEEIKAQDPSETLPTGFTSIDTALDGGLHPGLYILGALSSLGKTTLALQIADNIASSGRRDVLIVSLEQGKSELTAKSLSRLTRSLSGEAERRAGALTSRAISTHAQWSRWSQTQRDTFSRALELYQDSARRLWIKEGIGNIGVDDIRRFVERHVQRTGTAPLVVVDYLQILAPADTRSTDKANTDRAVTELKRLSRDYKTPVLAISSLNRASYSGPVSMEAFKESGAIEYGSDVLLGLQTAGLDDGTSDTARSNNKRTVEGSKRQATRWTELKVLKNRNGALGDPITLKFEAMFSHFEEPSQQDLSPASMKQL